MQNGVVFRHPVFIMKRRGGRTNGGGMRVEVVIPAYNEENSIAQVVAAIPARVVDRIIVVDNGSWDRTVETARNAGAYVVSEPRRGYGSACLRGIAEAAGAEVVVFLDGDFSDDPSELPRLLEPIREQQIDLVIGSRVLGRNEPGALALHQRLGNRLACFLIRLLFGYTFTDLGPFRAIRGTALRQLAMQDPTFGWTVEMQVKAAIHGLRCCEVPVSYRKRIGQSKITGTVRGSLKAGAKILYTVFRLWLKRKQVRISA